MTNLANLYVSGDNVTRATLPGLTNLTVLYLDSNPLNDLSGVASFTALQTLVASYSSVSDLTPLAGLTNLTTLDLGQNAITDSDTPGGPDRPAIIERG